MFSAGVPQKSTRRRVLPTGPSKLSANVPSDTLLIKTSPVLIPFPGNNSYEKPLSSIYSSFPVTRPTAVRG